MNLTEVCAQCAGPLSDNGDELYCPSCDGTPRQPYKRNKDQWRQYMQEYRKRNPLLVSQASAKYHAAHPHKNRSGKYRNFSPASYMREYRRRKKVTVAS